MHSAANGPTRSTITFTPEADRQLIEEFLSALAHECANKAQHCITTNIANVAWAFSRLYLAPQTQEVVLGWCIGQCGRGSILPKIGCRFLRPLSPREK